jgi:hypothetical protein
MYTQMSKVPVLRISTVRGCGGVDLHTRSQPALLSFFATSDYSRALPLMLWLRDTLSISRATELLAAGIMATLCSKDVAPSFDCNVIIYRLGHRTIPDSRSFPSWLHSRSCTALPGSRADEKRPGRPSPDNTDKPGFRLRRLHTRKLIAHHAM